MDSDLRNLSLPSLLLIIGGTLVLWKVFRAIFAPFLSRRSLPPGPPPLPLIGNLLDIPKEKEWLTFGAWGDKWGDLIHVSLPGQPGLLILNSVKAATDLLDKQSSIYSDRPVVPMGGELVGWKRVLGLLRYKPGASAPELSADTLRFKTIRRHFHQVLGSQTSVQKFDAVLESETKAFLRRVLGEVEGERWKNLQEHIRRTAAGGALHMIYGYQADETGDPFVALADRAMSTFSISTSPGGFLVNSIPILRYVPSWFPGGGFQKTAQEWKKIGDDLTDKPYNWVQSQMHTGKVPYSFVSSLLDGSDPTPEQGYDIKWAASSMYAGAADTTVASVYSLFQAMAIYPDVLKKAQEELDSVVGTERLPLLSDRPDLPYVNALTSELLRWHTVAPLALPHCAAEDNFYEGYFIPKGTLIFANVWKMGHNANDYHDPEVFNPDRFLGLSPEPDPRTYCWGFGRRICPGRLLADSSVFINCAMALAAFDITKYSDKGEMVEPVVDQTSGIISHPMAFKCMIRPRSSRILDLL